MEDIKINLTSLPYAKRSASVFWWTLIPYLILLFIIGLNTGTNGFIITLVCLIGLFLIDFYRRLSWVSYSLVKLETNDQGIYLQFYEKDELIETLINWENLSLSKGSTFTRNPRNIITFNSDSKFIASFYEMDNFTNEKIVELYESLMKLKISANK